MKFINKLAIGVVVLAVLAYLGFSYTLAKSIVMPKTLTLEEERKWIEEHNLLGDFDSYDKQDYQIKTYNSSKEYTINAQFIKYPEESNKYVIITHGFGSNRNGSIKYVNVYRKLGYNIIIYDVRGHGLNEKTPVSLGNFESEDLYWIIQDTYVRYGEDIYLGLHGESMGSAISLSVLKDNPTIQFVVADCGFSNLYDLIYSSYKDNNTDLLIYGVNAMTSLVYGVDMKKTSPMDAFYDNEVPILFIHGEDDSFIKPENSKIMFEKNESRDELHIIPNAQHAESRATLGIDEYAKIIEDFLNK